MTRPLALLVVTAALGALLASVAGATRGPGLAVYSVLPDGSDRRLVAAIDESMTFLGRSPDGRRMLVVHHENYQSTMYVSDLAGTNVVRISQANAFGAAAFSPDGSKVALVAFRFCSRPCTMAGLSVVNADGSDPRFVARGLSLGGPRPSWSPDGTRIVFVQLGRLKVARLGDGRVTDLGRGLDAAWAPRGIRIAYMAFRHGFHVPCFVNANGSNRLCARGSANGSLVWSPDAKRIAFQYGSGSMLAVLRSNARGLRRLRVRGLPTPLVWSPDSRRIAYSTSLVPQILIRPVSSGPSRVRRVTNERASAIVGDVRWRNGRISYVVRTAP